MFVSLLICFVVFGRSFSNENVWSFSGGPNSYLAFNSWRPSLTGAVRFQIRTNSSDGTLFYIDDRGKFDFFYLKLIEGHLRLLFNLGNDRQALNINRKINDNQWHTITIERLGKLTFLSIDHRQHQVSVMTHSEDLFFGGATADEYQASTFYFGGIPSSLEKGNSLNLSSFDVFRQIRFSGELGRIEMLNKSEENFLELQPIDRNDEVRRISIEKEKSFFLNDQQFSFDGRNSIRQSLNSTIFSSTELISFEIKTTILDGLIVDFFPSKFSIKIKNGQIFVEFCTNVLCFHVSTKNQTVFDNRWHFVQIQRAERQLTLIVDEQETFSENEILPDEILRIEQIFIAGNEHLPANKIEGNRFEGCLKRFSVVFNSNETILLENSTQQRFSKCLEFFPPVQTFGDSNYFSVPISHRSNRKVSIFFRFQTFLSDGVLLYAFSRNSSVDEFFSFDLIDGFMSVTVHFRSLNKRQELFQQRFNDGQTHSIRIQIEHFDGKIRFDVSVDQRQNNKVAFRTQIDNFELKRLTIGGVDPKDRWFPTSFWAGILKRNFIGCISQFTIDDQRLNLMKFIEKNRSKSSSVRSGICSTIAIRKGLCHCEHGSEIRFDRSARCSCECWKTAFTGSRCQKRAEHIDLRRISTIEWNSQFQWSEQIDDVSFRFKSTNDEDSFLQIRSCRLNSKCFFSNFSIRNGSLSVDFENKTMINFHHPFLLDQQWHFIHLRRFNNLLFVQIDQNLFQNFVNINLTSTFATVWLIISSGKSVLIEDLRLYDQSIYKQIRQNNLQHAKIFKQRPWRPINPVSLENSFNSFVEFTLNKQFCQNCAAETIDFDFRTKQFSGILFFAPIQSNSSSDSLLISLIHGKIKVVIKIGSSIDELWDDKFVNDGRWHHISLSSMSGEIWRIDIDDDEYFSSKSFSIFDRICFGRSKSIENSNSMKTLESCVSSLSVNGQSINLRESIENEVEVRNECFLDSKCPLRTCRNTGHCVDRVECQCSHTSFQGRFCDQFRIGYRFDSNSTGLVFEQPYSPEKPFQVYRLSFGLKTTIDFAELIRINQRFSVEIDQGKLSLRLDQKELIDNSRLVNDGFYHLVQIIYNSTRHFQLIVDNIPNRKILSQSLFFDKALLLLIGQNPTFNKSFEGELFGLESDYFSIFDLLSATFQRLESSSNRSLFMQKANVLLPSTDDEESSSCSNEVFDEICIVQSEKNGTLLTFDEPILTTRKKISTTTMLIERTSSINEQYFMTITPPWKSSRNSTEFNDDFSLFTFSLYVIFIFLAVVLSIFILFCLVAKLRRKDHGVYQLQQAQQFRPLVVEVSSSSAEKNSATNSSTKSTIKRQNKSKHSTNINDEQREFYI